MYFINPNEIEFENLADAKVMTSSQAIAEDIVIKNKARDIFTITSPTQGAMDIRRGLYDQARLHGDLIRVDFSRSKARRVTVDQAFQQTVERVDSTFDPTTIEIKTTRLADVNFDPKLFIPIKTGTYLDTFFSYKGGILPGINIMGTGDPGVGKSSNFMEMLVNIKKYDDTRRVLYVSSEMSEVDVKEFEKYYPGLENIDFLFLSQYITNPELNIKPVHALQSVLHQGWDIIVLDSLIEIQSSIMEDLDLSTKQTEKWMLDLMAKHNQGYNKEGIYSTFFCIQQKNKSGQYVGSKRLEHMTSAFIQFNWHPKENGKRYMIFEKNRKGKERVPLYYWFSETGIAYDEKRHAKELEILSRLQTAESLTLGEMDLDEFEKMLSAPPKEEAPMV